MSLFPTENQDVLPPKHIRIIDMMRMKNKRSLEERKQTITINFQQFWSSREIAEAILAELWTEAWDWFVQSYQEQLAIKSLDPTWEIKFAPYEYTHHDDWRVTLN